ncbi:MAG: hypothetical protein J6T32_01250 [Paludibacteraceae bacterium]|nr:hypothetical protein [Paludibacteraceae bacterium]
MNRLIVHISTLLLLLATTSLSAQTLGEARHAEAAKRCEDLITELNYPYFYCECHNTAQDFEFGLDMNISDTTWFKATTAQLRQGLSAYWFATSSVTIEVYALCSSTMPTLVLTVGANQMHEKDADEINKRIGEMGATAESILSNLTPRIRVYPNKEGGSGRVICYPYNQGPHSTCDNPLRVIPGMTYVSSNTEDVYCLEDIQKYSDNMFIHWKEKDNSPCQLYVTSDSCNGPLLANTTLSDSTKVFAPGAEFMQSARQDNKALFFHFSHAEGKTGRITFYRSAIFVNDSVKETLCQGRGIVLKDTVLRQTTLYTDTTWMKRDTMLVTSYDLLITPPVQLTDTIAITSKQLPYPYRNTQLLNNFGDYLVHVHTPNACDEDYQVHVDHRIIYPTTEQEESLCIGKTYKTSDGQIISRDTTIVDSIWRDIDTCAITSLTLHFTQLEPEDTLIYLNKEQIKTFYFLGKSSYRQFGEYDIVYTRKNNCTRYIHLTIQEVELPTALTETEEGRPASPQKQLYRGTLYIEKNGQRYTIFGNKM